MSSAKWSWPAGTAVCVVNTVLAATASIAAAKSTPCLRDRDARTLQHLERGVPLVDVPDGRLVPERDERAHAADAEHDFLLEARLAVAAVEPVRDAAVGVAVVRDVGVEHVEPHVPDLRLPDLDAHHAARQLDLDEQLAAGAVVHRLDRQCLEVGVEVGGLLVAVTVDGLREVALPVEQADRDEGQAAVAGRLAVVPGEDAEAAGVDREALVEPELRAEVGDQVVGAELVDLAPPHAGADVRVVGRQHAVQVGEVDRILGRAVEPRLVDLLEQSLRALVDRMPERGVEPREQVARGPVP